MLVDVAVREAMRTAGWARVAGAVGGGRGPHEQAHMNRFGRRGR